MVRTPIWPVAAAALFLSVSCILAAPKEIRRPPVGETLSVEVMRGGRATITLKAYEGRNNPLVYEIVRPPEHGRLVEFRQADSNRQGFATVIYQHNDSETSYEDAFAFKARAEGGGVSSPIAVKIRIIDQPPRLAAPSRIEFSAVAGESDFRVIGLTNAGGAVLEGRLAPEEPFYVEGDGRFRLGRGESVSLSIGFSPKSVEAVRPQKITPSRADPGGVIVLAAEAKVPFAAEAGAMEVQPDGSRTGRIVVTNFCSYPLNLSLQLQPEGVAELVPERKIAVGGTAEIPVRIGLDKKGGLLEFRARLADEFYAVELPMQAPAVPPKLELLTPELDFRRGNEEASLEVQNMGGVAGRFTLELPPQLQSLDGATSFAVAAGESKSARLLRKNSSERGTATLMVDLGRGGKIPVALLFAEPSPTPTPTPVVATPSPKILPTAPAKPWKLNEDLQLEKSEDGKVFVAWVVEKDGWTDATLQVIEAEGERPYPAEPEPQGWWSSLVAWWSGRTAEVEKARADIEKKFKDRNTVPGEEIDDAPVEDPEKAERRSAEILPQDLANPDLRWRLTARDRDSDSRESVSEDFVADVPGWLLAAAERQTTVEENIPTAQAAGSPMPERTTPVLARRTDDRIQAARKIHATAVTAERTRAKVIVAIEAEPDITGYRLERCEMVSEIDPVTGIPLRPRYEPIQHEGQVTILGASAAEYEGKKLSAVVATIDGLKAGTATMWRLVPLAGEESLTPTGEFLVPTEPPWRPPWRTILLGLLFAVLATVLWLRHKQRKAW
jgi:hypothetical protein